MGDQCQTDRFETSLEKTNPGVAIFSCSFTASSGQNLLSDYVKADVGTSFTEPWITHVSSNTSGTTINNSYIHKYMGPEEPIYCFVGAPDSSSEFAFVRLPPRDFFVLPSYNGVPELLESGSYHAVIGWRQWDPSSDTGDGPIVGYKIYVRSDNIIVLTKEVQPSSMVNNTDRSVSKRSAENATEMVMYNVSGLEAGSTYSVHIAAIRDGINGEGAQGAALTFTTEKIVPTTTPSSSTVSTPMMIGPDEGGLGGAPIAPAAGGAVGAILLILIIIIVVIIVFKRRRNDSNPSKKGNVEDQYQAPAGFHDTSLEGNDYSGHDSVSNPDQTHSRSTRPKPAVVVKPFVRATKSLDLDSTDGSPERSSNKPFATRQPIPMAQFPAFVNKNRHTALFSQEFHDLPGPDIYPQTVAREKINFTKNRYKNILPYDSARVKLQVIDNDPHSDYFNASYIPSFDNDKAYIASQGPNNASMDDFWRMVWQENVTTIAMVTKLQEGDKIKCRQYWPNEEGDSVVFGNIKLELVSLEACTGGVKRKMGMRKGDDYRTVTQFHFTEWPDKGVPKHTSSLLQFIKEVRADHGQNTHPLIIHCSAGVGRTGVVISIDSVVAHAKRTRMVDVFNFVTNIRQKRPYMVQTQEQYAFIYGAVLEDLLWRNTLIPVIHFTDHLQDLHTSVGGSGRSKMTKEFETLKSLCPDPPPSRTRSGRTPDNQPKNRYGNNLPLQRNRVILDSPDQDYINASQMKGVHCTFVTTQMPLPTTVSDFWSMVVNSKPSTIAMLNDKSQNDKSCAQYWPDADSAQFGSYSVATLSTSSDGDVTTRQMKVTRNSNASHTVTQYQFHGWPKHGSDQQLGARSLIKLIRAVKSSTNNKKEFSILVHCLSGAGRTGVFCTAMECIAQIAEGNSVDIFQTVKILRADRMQFVQTEEEYAFVYDVIREYLHTENYEQLPYPKPEDHTYGNVEIDYRTLDPEENPYEVTDPQEAGAAALVYGNVETERSQDRPKPKPQQQCSIYENFEFES
ncbi:receptor-type tyrosine-protein phosphatase epsilon-like [Strongylocentrotus purpuratus]|uniref:protein-tyrosine-phosphatase n=1 Tax=Strongylocentrotus purpuratus TaxID=7668 RepID=A0A7M7NJH6_STRPU|nr:receptor-type tyrosine-protein phosphatase epsilon-like [Strongylocentrotus purpuratus]